MEHREISRDSLHDHTSASKGLHDAPAAATSRSHEGSSGPVCTRENGKSMAQALSKSNETDEDGVHSDNGSDTDRRAARVARPQAAKAEIKLKNGTYGFPVSNLHTLASGPKPEGASGQSSNGNSTTYYSTDQELEAALSALNADSRFHTVYLQDISALETLLIIWRRHQEYSMTVFVCWVTEAQRKKAKDLFTRFKPHIKHLKMS